MNDQVRIIGNPLPNIPWENRPPDSKKIVWRSVKNPIIPRDLIPKSNSIFNSAVIPYKNEFAGVFRVDHKSREMTLHKGFSSDGVSWEIDENQIEFICNDPDIAKFEFGYDPRLVKLDEKYYITWCNGYNLQPTIGVAYTVDFEKFYQLENAYLPFNRNGVLFPRKINEKFAMLNRPSDNGHTPFGDIFYSESPDMIHWGCHRHVMSPIPYTWQSTKVGAGPNPIETNIGWLLIYHGVLTSCNGFIYSMGATILDLEKPWKILYRTKPYLMSPQKLYECVGDVPNVFFPCSALTDSETGRIAIYYGAADTVTCLAYAKVDELIEFIKENTIYLKI